MRTSSGMLIASAAVGLILTGAVTGRADEQKTGGDVVHCVGVNACKGQGSCAGGPSGNSCAGKNDCKGKGVVDMSAADCAKKGGKPAEGKKM